MGRKKSKRIKIPKNRDIEELLEQDDKIETMEEVIEIMDNKEKEFRDRIKLENISINKKIENVYARKDAQIADENRKAEYIRAMNKLQEQEER